MFDELYTAKTIVFRGNRLKTAHLINIIDMFISKYVMFNKDSMKLSSKIMKWLYGGYYLRYIEYLMEGGFIYMSKNYSAGNRSKTYKLTEIAKDLEYMTTGVEIANQIVSKMENIRSTFDQVDERVKNKLVSDLYTVELDHTGAINWLRENMKTDQRAMFVNSTTCAKITSKDIYHSFDIYGRFHTNYTVLKREIRSRFLSIDGEPLKEIDISNSQPFFLYLLMQQHKFTDFDSFDKDVLSGKIYERLKDAANNEFTRKEVKVNTYSVLFGRNMNKGYWNQLFNSLYPNVYKWISDFKREQGNYKVIAQQLQRLESEFMYRTVVPELMFKLPHVKFITVHDSVIVQEKYYNEVKQIFDNCLERLILKS